MVEDDEDVVWEMDEGGNFTHILLGGLFSFPAKIQIKVQLGKLL